jgi:hypothetical protein
VLGSTVAIAPVAVDLEAELGRDDNLIAKRLERFANDFFARVGAVNLGGIEKGDASFTGGTEDRNALITVRRRAVDAGEGHGAHTGFRDAERAEFADLHRAP